MPWPRGCSCGVCLGSTHFPGPCRCVARARKRCPDDQSPQCPQSLGKSRELELFPPGQALPSSQQTAEASSSSCQGLSPRLPPLAGRSFPGFCWGLSPQCPAPLRLPSRSLPLQGSLWLTSETDSTVERCTRLSFLWSRCTCCCRFRPAPCCSSGRKPCGPERPATVHHGLRGLHSPGGDRRRFSPFPRGLHFQLWR